ncbi:MAG: PAS domain S-box protein [Gemmatimonadota bacterium]
MSEHGPVRQRSLARRLLVAIGSLVLVALAVLVWTAFLEARRSSQQSAEERLVRSAGVVAGLVDGAVQGLLGQSRRLTQDPALQAYALTRDPRVRADANRALRYTGPASDQLIAIELQAGDGKRLLVSGDSVDLPELTSSERASPGQPRFGQLRAISEVAAVPAIAPIIMDTAVVGWVVVWWRLRLTVRLTGAQGFLGNLDGSVWTDFERIVPPPLRTADTGPRSVRYERGDSAWIAGIAPASVGEWLVVVETAWPDVAAPAYQFLRRLALLSSLLFAICLSVVWQLSQRITTPLRRLTTAAETISAGDYTARVQTIGRDELGQLGASFNSMAERVQDAHQRIEEQAAQYHMLFKSNPSPMWVFDRASLRFLAVNHAAIHHYGYSREEFLNLTLKDIRPPEEVARLLEDVAQSHTGLDIGGVWSHRKKDGSIMSVEITSHEVMFDQHDAVMVLVHDVTERQRAEEALRTAHESLRTIVEAAPVAVYSLDRTGIVRTWNPGAERIFGWSGAEVIGKPLPTVPGDAQVQPEARLREVVDGGLLNGVELTRVTKDGSKVLVRLHASPLHDAKGVVTGIMVIAADISDVRRLEQQYRQAQKMEAVGRLAGGVAHDFNNLLTIILGESTMVLDQLSEDDPARIMVGDIMKAGERAAELTRQLLAFSRQQIVEPTVFQINDLVTDVEKMLRRLIGEDIRLNTRLDPAAGPVRADRNQFEQLLLNLSVNARDAMPDGGLLAIETTRVTLSDQYVDKHPDARPGEYVLLSVSDSGTGMSEEVRTHIFEPFFTTKAVQQGTGLGLAMCYGIVKQAGGLIDVYSEIGVGTIMKVYVPSTTQNATRASVAPARRTARGERILLVEDQPAVRALSVRMLQSLGYHVLQAADAESALVILEDVSQPLDLLITDVVMPGLKGSVLAERARALRPSLKVLFISGYTSDVAAYQKLVDEQAALLQKPFTTAVLGDRVRDVLDRPVST